VQIKMSDSLNSGSVAITSHKGIDIYWNTSQFDKTSFSGDYDIFEQINGYWAYLPEATQDMIFSIYQRIRSVFDEAGDSESLTAQLRGPIAELYRFHNQDDLHHWASFHADLRIPSSIKNESSPDLPPERTYLQNDYRQLVTLAISLRPMLPIWGEFIFMTRKEHGSVFKELYAAQLLRLSNIVHSEAYGRLKKFVEFSIPQDKSISSAILGGIGSQKFPEWLMGLVLVRRLSVGDVRGLDPVSHLVTFTFKYIQQKVKGHDSNFEGVVKDKPTVDDRSEGENNISVAEGYKIKEQTAAGDIVVQSWYTEDIERMALKVDPSLDLRILNKSIQSTRLLANAQIHECQTTLMQWVMADALSPRGLLRLNKEAILRVMAATQAILWHQGYLELAALVSAIAQDNDGEQFVSGGESKARLTKDQVEVLNRLYPHHRRTGGRSKTTRQPNAAITALENVNDLFSEFDWKLTLPIEWLERVTGRRDRRYATPYDMKQKLAELIIAIASKEPI